MANVRQAISDNLHNPKTAISNGLRIFCSKCKEESCWMYGEDCKPTSLSCGHMLCFKCANNLWSEAKTDRQTSVFCVTCTADVEITTVKCPPFAKPEPQKAESSTSSLAQCRLAASVGESTVPPAVVQTTPRAARAPSDVPPLPSSAGSAACSTDHAASTLSSPLVLDKIQSQDDAWRLLQNDEGFIRDWIVANVPDHVLFKMVGEGSADSASMENNNAVFNNSTSTVIVTPPSTLGPPATATEIGGIGLPPPSVFDSGSKSSFEQQFLHYLVNKAAQDREDNSDSEDAAADVKASATTDGQADQHKTVPHTLPDNQTPVVDNSFTICNKEDGRMQLGKGLQQNLQEDDSRVSAVRKNVHLGPRILPIRHPHSLLKDVQSEALNDSQYSSEYPHQVFSARPYQPTSVHFPPGNSAFQNPNIQHNYPPSMYEEGVNHYAGYNLRHQANVGEASGMPSHNSGDVQNLAGSYPFQHGQFSVKHPRNRYSVGYCRPGHQQKLSQRGSKSARNRCTNQNRRSAVPGHFSWFSQACGSALVPMPATQYSSKPQIRCVQVVRPKADMSSQQEQLGESRDSAVELEDSNTQAGEAEEAEVAVMKTRSMPTGARVEDIYVVPQVWLNGGRASTPPRCCPGSPYAFQDRDPAVLEHFNEISDQHSQFNVILKERGVQLRSLGQEDEMLTTSGHGRTEVSVKEFEMIDDVASVVVLPKGNQRQRNLEDAGDYSDFQPVAVVTTLPAKRSDHEISQQPIEKLLPPSTATSAPRGWRHDKQAAMCDSAGFKRKFETIQEMGSALVYAHETHGTSENVIVPQFIAPISANEDDCVEIVEQNSTHPSSILLEAGAHGKKKLKRNLVSEFYSSVDGQDLVPEYLSRAAQSVPPTSFRERWYEPCAPRYNKNQPIQQAFYHPYPSYHPHSFYINTDATKPGSAFRYGHTGFPTAQFPESTGYFSATKLSRYYSESSLERRSSHCSSSNQISTAYLRRSLSPTMTHPDILSHLSSGCMDKDFSRLPVETQPLGPEDPRLNSSRRQNMPLEAATALDMESGAGRLHFWPVQGERISDDGDCSDSVDENRLFAADHNHRIHPDELAVVQWLLRETADLNQYLENDLLTSLSVSLMVLEKRALQDSDSKPSCASTDKKTADLDHLLRCILSLGQVVVHYGWWCRPQYWDQCQGAWSTMRFLASQVFQESVQYLNRVVSFYLERMWISENCDAQMRSSGQYYEEVSQKSYCATPQNYVSLVHEPAGQLKRPKGQSDSFTNYSHLGNLLATKVGSQTFATEIVDASQDRALSEPAEMQQDYVEACENSRPADNICTLSYISAPLNQGAQPESLINQDILHESDQKMNNRSSKTHTCLTSLEDGCKEPPCNSINSEDGHLVDAGTVDSHCPSAPDSAAFNGDNSDQSPTFYQTSGDSGLGDSTHASSSLEECEAVEKQNYFGHCLKSETDKESLHQVFVADEGMSHVPINGVLVYNEEPEVFAQDDRSDEHEENVIEELHESTALLTEPKAEGMFILSLSQSEQASEEQVCSGEEVISDHAIMMSEIVEVETDGTVEVNETQESDCGQVPVVDMTQESDCGQVPGVDIHGQDLLDSIDNMDEEETGGRCERSKTAPCRKKSSRLNSDEKVVKGKWNLRSSKISPSKLKTSPRNIPKRF